MLQNVCDDRAYLEAEHPLHARQLFLDFFESREPLRLVFEFFTEFEDFLVMELVLLIRRRPHFLEQVFTFFVGQSF